MCPWLLTLGQEAHARVRIDEQDQARLPFHTQRMCHEPHGWDMLKQQEP